MTDKELIKKVYSKTLEVEYPPNEDYWSDWSKRVLVRYTRWLERAKIYGVIAKARQRVGIND